MPVTISSTRTKSLDKARREAIARVVAELDLTQFSCWDDLDTLSSHTNVDDIQILEDEITIRDDHFNGVLNVYVLLQYGQGDDQFTSPDAFPGKFSGHFDGDGSVFVDEVTVDTSSFYE